MSATVATALDPREIGNLLMSPLAFTEARIHDLFAAMRAHGAPLWVTPDNTRPFWAVTRHAQIVEASSRNDVFISSRRSTMLNRAQEAAAFRGAEKYGRVLRSLIHMDMPDHKRYRAVAQPWFNAAAVRGWQPLLDELTREFLGKFTTDGGGRGRIDFAAEVATLFPLRVIMAILGVPVADLPLMHRLTKTLAAPQDADLGATAATGDTLFDSIPLFTDYFLDFITERRRHPRDDLASTIANGNVDGEPMGELETVSYFITMIVAGHDTTAAAMAGGCHALAERPADWARLRADPGLLRTVPDEMIRWVTPIRHFMRTAAADHMLGGQLIRKDESITMFYLSANRDEDVFEAADQFRLDRAPNRQIAFGFGPHVCMGMVLSRLELATWFGAMARRIETLAQDGEVRMITTNFLGGYKLAPIRYTLAA